MSDRRRIRYDNRQAFIWHRWISTWAGYPVVDKSGWLPLNPNLKPRKWPEWAGLKSNGRVITNTER